MKNIEVQRQPRVTSINYIINKYKIPKYNVELITN